MGQGAEEVRVSQGPFRVRVRCWGTWLKEMRAVGHVRGSWRDRDFLMEVSRWKSFLVEKFLMEKFPMVQTAKFGVSPRLNG